MPGARRCCHDCCHRPGGRRLRASLASDELFMASTRWVGEPSALPTGRGPHAKASTPKRTRNANSTKRHALLCLMKTRGGGRRSL